ncbi:SidA/IucD/PvdA family monooxygenase [Pseudomonas tremae]|uniref:SidA/IucD/PvdA family monooxygenase n=1 Tax=Pseudomonas tremae TaxID=200454 RepID=UPI001F3AD56B|nr:SidA/IucD/PvdA family monooxygenase [Pseudomonas tremae]MCF5714918.1 SidA/IucD/PvdA family monooxygenase [Pseudomonas tremae]UQB31807.1 SidA/IucD/PvdA family monooxygenase [Pseudomonas tremae]
MTDIYDVIGVGFGPANIALAVALDEKALGGQYLFLEGNTAPDWQSEMLIDGSDTQHNPLRDFVTPRNPTSPYGFLSYLKAKNRLFDYLNLGLEFPYRLEYARYVRWVARQFDHWVSYGERVTAISRTGNSGELIRVETNLGRSLLARTLSFGPGRTPFVPEIFDKDFSGRVSHFTGYITANARWCAEGEPKSIAVIGSSQSAVELTLDLNARYPDAIIHNIFRSFSYQLKDTSPFTENVYFPEFVDDFYDAPLELQKKLTSEMLRSNYSSADMDVIKSLYHKIYMQKLNGRERIHLHNMSDITGAELDCKQVKLALQNNLKRSSSQITVDAVVLATGFRNLGSGRNDEFLPPLLQNMAGEVNKRVDGSVKIERDYLISSSDPHFPPIFLNGLCESTHGFGDAGSFSLLSLRSWMIAEKIEYLTAPVASNPASNFKSEAVV